MESNLLIYLAAIAIIIALCLLVNEKKLNIPPEIAVLCLALVIGFIVKVLIITGVIPPDSTFMIKITSFRLDKLLLDSLLCFMLFSGASDLKYGNLKKRIVPITLFALLTTIVTAVAYGACVYFLTKLLGFSISFVICVLIGAIISPTDPIAATGILNKIGLPDELLEIMEGESLFNDGTGVALYLFVSSLISGDGSTSFVLLMLKEIIGALIVGLIFSWIGCKIVSKTKNEIIHIVSSLFSVCACYSVADLCGCSGVIASVVCGIYFATKMETYEETGVIDGPKLYVNFWSIIDKLFNYFLYVLIGLSFIVLVKADKFLIVIVLAVIVNLVTRYLGISVSTIFLKKVPGDYRFHQFASLMTWSGLKGGVSLALAMSSVELLEANVYQRTLLIVFLTIIFTTIVQGLTVDKLYLKIEKDKAECLQTLKK